jgi:hypothetical protein
MRLYYTIIYNHPHERSYCNDGDLVLISLQVLLGGVLSWRRCSISAVEKMCTSSQFKSLVGKEKMSDERVGIFEYIREISYYVEFCMT